MKPLHNPISGEVKLCTPLEAKKLKDYGWKSISTAEYAKHRHEVVRAIVQKNVLKPRVRIH